MPFCSNFDKENMMDFSLTESVVMAIPKRTMNTDATILGNISSCQIRTFHWSGVTHLGVN